jgi:hypothetical protein
MLSQAGNQENLLAGEEPYISTKVISYHYGCILLVRGISQFCQHLRGGSSSGMNPRRWGSLGPFKAHSKALCVYCMDISLVIVGQTHFFVQTLKTNLIANELEESNFKFYVGQVPVAHAYNPSSLGG